MNETNKKDKQIEELAEFLKKTGIPLDSDYDYDNNKSLNISKPGRDEVKKEIEKYLD